jgi:hypothetical protein
VQIWKLREEMRLEKNQLDLQRREHAHMYDAERLDIENLRRDFESKLARQTSKAVLEAAARLSPSRAQVVQALSAERTRLDGQAASLARARREWHSQKAQELAKWEEVERARASVSHFLSLTLGHAA